MAQRLLVVGSAKNATTGQNEATLWKLAPAPPVAVVAPQLSIIGAKKITTTRAKLAIKGRTSGLVTSVTYRLGSKAEKRAAGTASWKFQTGLRPGKNQIIVTAHGPGGDSAPAKLTVRRRS